ncbi:hypothetical protein HWV62_19515 [Athelia sp. TMB]|nr:hypothetical protein HWV62_19515 [Athelia sp. TMB]
MAEVSESEEDRAVVRFSTHGTLGGTVNNINGHYIYGNLNHFDIHLPPIPASKWGQVLEGIRRSLILLPNAEQPLIHSPSRSNISQNVLSRSTRGVCYSSDKDSIVRIRVMIEMVRTMMLNPMFCSSANLLKTLAALERVLYLTKLAIEAYRYTPLAKSLSRAIAMRVEDCRKLLEELLKNLSDYRHVLSEAFLYFIRRYVCRRWGEGGIGPVMDSRLRDCHKSFAACLLALGRAAWPELEQGSDQETLDSLAEFYHELELESASLMHITVDSVTVDFHTVISGFCRDTAGYYLIQRGNYRILNPEDDRIISRTEISTSLERGMKVEMSIVLHTQAKGKRGSQAQTCPRCKHVNRKINCGGRFHNSTDDGSIISPEVRAETENAPQDLQYIRRISVLQDAVHEMEIAETADDADKASPRNLENNSAAEATRASNGPASPLPGASIGATGATTSGNSTLLNPAPTAQQVVHQPADPLTQSLYKVDLAKANALKDESAALLDLGRRQEAMAAITEATDLFRALASKHPALNAELALSLRTLSSRLGDVGQKEEALFAIEEVVELQRSLANEHSSEFNIELACSLNHLSNRLSRLDRHEEALLAIQESVDLYRAAVEDHPETSQPGLAASLYNLSTRLSKYGLQEEALAAIQEASGIYQTLAAEDPATYETKHKLSLAKLSDCLKSFGQMEDAIAASFPSETATCDRDRAASDRPGEATVYTGPIFNTIGTFGGTVKNVVGDYVTVDEDLAKISRMLPYAEGASWNPQLTCFPGTRLAMLAEIDTWAREAGSEKICLLKGPAGCGKSAALHTIAEALKAKGLLVSAFFFSRDTASRNTPKTLFTTMARDIARLRPRAAADISAALEAEPALASASLSRQFDVLILGPSRHLPTDRAAVFAIDALDESINHDLDTELLAILRDKATQLPPQVRILVASRPTSIIEEYLSGRSHIKMHSIEIFSSENKRDIDLYVDAQLRDEAILSKMGLTSPDETVIRDLKRLAEGLFVWIVTICNFLRTAYRPKDKLQALLSKSYRQGSPPEKKMNLLYAAILAECGDWEDPYFVRDYDLVMGTIMALKRPLSLAALRALHDGSQDLEAEQLLQRFGSVPSASSTHPFTDRAANEESTKRFHLSEKEHSGRLAELCVKTLNRELARPIGGTGYLAIETLHVGIPNICDVSEQLVYGCAHWPSHLQDVERPQTIQAHIVTLISRRLVKWIEVLAATDVFHGSLQIGQWVQQRAPGLEYHFQYDSQANAMIALGNRLSHAGRMEESLLATEEGVVLFRILARGRPAMYSGALASSLANLSSRLSALGRSEEAMPAINEAVNLYRALAAEQPAEYNAGLASSLINLSNRLSDLGRAREALSAVEKAVNLRRALAAERPAAYNANLATSLNNFSIRLSDLGRAQEALSVAEEAVDLRRALAAERPAAYNADLATSLNNLSAHLAALGRTHEALSAAEEAVDLRRALAAERPATYNADLADSLNNLSARLSALGRAQEALSAVEEAVNLRRALAAERPAAYNAALATSLNNLSAHLAALGRAQEALSAVEKAVNLRRALAAERPAACNGDLAMGLGNLSANFGALGRTQEALSAAEEMVILFRSLATERPAAYNADLAKSLQHLSRCLTYLGRQEEALIVIPEAVDLYRALAAERPAQFNEPLMRSLMTLSNAIVRLELDVPTEIRQEIRYLQAQVA